MENSVLGKPDAIPLNSSAVRRLAPLNFQKHIPVLFAFTLGWSIWHVSPVHPLTENGIHFLSTLVAAVILWAFEVLDEYIVALLLLVSWAVLHIVPPKIALAGFSESSWFFAVAALGIGAAVGKAALFDRLAIRFLRLIRPEDQTSCTFF